MEATGLVARANAAFEAKQYAQAVDLYNQALENAAALGDQHHIVLSNRAACLLCLGRGDAALRDAQLLLRLRPEWAKGYGRAGAAYLLLRRWEEAQSAFQHAMELEPNNPEWSAAVDEARQKAARTHPEELDCSICMKLLYEPVTTPCGHTFCRICLRRAVDHSPSCPLCRGVLHVHAPTVSVVLKSLLERNYAAEYAARAEEVKAEAQVNETSLPLFVLDAVVFPGGSFPMHIFEPRYRLMLRRCLEGSKQFGLVPCYQDRNSARGYAVAEVGTILKITSHRPLPDGRSYIDCVGTTRFRILSRREMDGYLVGHVAPIEDEPCAPEELQQAATRVRAAVQRCMATPLAQLFPEAQNGMPEDAVALSFWIPSQLSRFIPVALAIELLSRQSAVERLDASVAVLASVARAERPGAATCSSQ
jgi:Lon protease-like protein